MSEGTGAAPVLQVQRVDGFWLARLNRPEKRNALSDELVGELTSLFGRVGDDLEARALVLWGAGGHFSAGADFSRFMSFMSGASSAHGEDPIATYNRQFGTMLERLVAVPVPTIAVVTGSAMGGGFGLSATCDRVLASETAVFSMTEVTIGVAPAQIAPFVIRKLGLTRARWLMLSGARLNAAQAKEVGLADQVCAAGDLKAQLAETLGQLANGEPAALRATKRIINRTQQVPLAEALDSAAQEFAGLLRHGKVIEGIASSREKRPPAWRVAVPELPDLT
jgi:isohexenylglutaconyl-CoA hydratase